MNFFMLDLISISLVFAWIIILLCGLIRKNFGIFSAILAAFHFLISNNLWESVWTLLTNLAFKLSVYGQLFYYKTNLVSIHCPGVIIGVVIIATLISKSKKKKSLLKWWFKECYLDKLSYSDSLKKISYARKYCVYPVQDSGEMNQEARRLASFRHRTATSPSATVLAHSGLYYDRNLCCMRCFRYIKFFIYFYIYELTTVNFYIKLILLQCFGLLNKVTKYSYYLLYQANIIWICIVLFFNTRIISVYKTIHEVTAVKV